MGTADTPTNDKTGSILITKEKFDTAAVAVGVDSKLQAALWAKLCDSSSSRIIAGATAPREDAANVNNWHWFEKDLAPWSKARLEALLVGVAAQKVCSTVPCAALPKTCQDAAQLRILHTGAR